MVEVTAAPDPWTQAKIATRSSVSINGPRSRQALRIPISTLGPNELESPRSDDHLYRVDLTR